MVDIKEMMKKIPLSTRFRVANQMAFISLLTELGYREDKMWTQDEDEVINKLYGLADKHTADLFDEWVQWEKDGKPK